MTGATTEELIARLGHASLAAALRSQHATEDGDAAVARAIATLAPRCQGGADRERSPKSIAHELRTLRSRWFGEAG